ncbi:SDR family oxidoreductase [Trinickia diaoshuihuensis]|uniref:SDR family oxidoreductase n=1 Tax=Trinickia diaoshuihuensis TaxID=2292265 RepID=UPI000E226B0A|nr:SDR family oxidoreductase [Trinickia diaoshuihuensis]
MNVLVCGAHGFVGQAVCTALARRGYRILKGIRHAKESDEFEVDYTTNLDPASWTSKLRDIDVVINAVGILIERAGQTFELVHHRAPVALFEAACRAGVRHIVQISALGAHTGTTAYFKSKLAADEYLMSQPVEHHILRPALVYGPDGKSSRFFRTIAASPIHPLPAGGHQWVRPIHVDDLAEIVVRLIDHVNLQPNAAVRSEARVDADTPAVLELVGHTRLEYKDMLAVYRRSMAFEPAWQFSIPRRFVDIAAKVCDRIPGSMLTRDTWHMLEQGSSAEVDTTARILGRPPAGIEMFIGPVEAMSLRQTALAFWRSLSLRIALAITWLGTAVCSAFFYPKAESLALLARLHLHGGAALGLLYGASAIDAMIGVLTLTHPGKRLWIAQAFLVGLYSCIVAITLPEFLWHPFGPILKNVPILAVLGVLTMEETTS